MISYQYHFQIISKVKFRYNKRLRTGLFQSFPIYVKTPLFKGVSRDFHPKNPRLPYVFPYLKASPCLGGYKVPL